ncbi:probable inactive shikimate kinase like 1, chloroplastic isoform X1 [Diospyros lotus]|uniref:probable inactive shikimate kinase like 1, chloroplastic isoform X1 n=1 Tax=Diospyros lotus TaxID=55363 RepID=UPI0022514315|nr:probable inactive shikimate kinase like 1, chloroplastic isoform X1 [Diospyros lotus]
MEMIPATSCDGFRSQLALRHPPFPCFQVQSPLVRLSRVSRSCRSSRFHSPSSPPSTSLLCPSPIPNRKTNRRTFSVHSLPDQAPASSSGSVTKVVEVDPSVAVKVRSGFHLSCTTIENEEEIVLIQKKAIQITPALKGTSIFLVGINSSLKTSVGQLLADALRYYYFDSDSLVEEAGGGESGGKSFRERDTAGFRESEIEVLKQLSSMGRLVVCTGNGAVQTAANLALLRHGLSIWIDVPLDMVAMDIIRSGSQLSASENFGSGSYPEVFDQLAELYEEMRGGYATADATVSLQKVANQLGYDELDAVAKEDIALEVLKEIEKLIRVKKMMEEAARPF